MSEKPKGIPRSFWQKYGVPILRMAGIAFAILGTVFVIWWLTVDGNQQRHVEASRNAQRAMYYCLDNHDSERDLLVCMEREGFVIAWDWSGNRRRLAIGDYWPESEQP